MDTPAPPIFVVGANRSGTTLVRLILNAHPHIAIPEELNYFKTIPYNRPWNEPGWTDRGAYSHFVDRTLEKHIPLLPGLDAETVRPQLLAVDAPTYRTPYAYLLEAWAAQEGKPRWGEKTPGNLFHIDRLIEMFPDAQFIYVERDPRAGVASMQRVSFFPNDIVINALNRRKSWMVGRELLKRTVPADQQILVRYEDLVRNPEQIAQALCAFLNEPYDSEMLRFHTDAEHYMKTEAAESFNEAATHPISTARIERWKTDLSAIEVGWIESICAEEMAMCGYDPSYPPRTLYARAVEYMKSAYWHYHIWRHRRYRPYIVRHTPGASVRDAIRSWLQSIDLANSPIKS